MTLLKSERHSPRDKWAEMPSDDYDFLSDDKDSQPDKYKWRT